MMLNGNKKGRDYLPRPFFKPIFYYLPFDMVDKLIIHQTHHPIYLYL